MTKILLVGDSILDIYVNGTAIGKSAETPTIVARELQTEHSLGGAFLVARNLLELGAQVAFATLTGGDAEAEIVCQFQHENLKMIPLRDAARRTTVKKRFWVDNYKLLQFDTLDNRPIPEPLQEELLGRIKSEIGTVDRVILSDYRHGLLPRPLIGKILKVCKEAGKTVFVDSQVSQSQANHADYTGADWFCLNLQEARCLAADFDPAHAEEGFRHLAGVLGTRQIVVKLGEKGCVAQIGGRILSSNALKLNPVDTCGAGDAFLSALAMGDLTQPEGALSFANRWAGLSTLVRGAHPPKIAELEKLRQKESP